MSRIRQVQALYNAAKIIFLLCLLLFNSQKVGFALSYWDAVFEIGFNPDTKQIDTKAACRQIERLIDFRTSIRERPVLYEKQNSKIREVRSQISSLDSGNLYDQLPYSDSRGVWRGIGVRGELDEDHYQLSIIDPGIEHWANSALIEMPEAWGLQKKFGDVGLRAFLRPTTSKRFKFKAEGHIYTDDLNVSNLMRIIRQLVNATWLLAHDGEYPPDKFLKDSTLNKRSLKVIYGLARNFPHLFTILSQYFTIENMVSGAVAEGRGPMTFDIVIRIDVDAIKKDYPYLGEIISRLNGILNYQQILTDAQNRPIASMAFDGDNYLFLMRFKTQAGRFLLLTEHSKNTEETVFDLTVSGHQRLNMIHTFRVNIAGLKLNIEALKLNLNYYYDEYTSNIRAELQQTPEQITAEGLILGFLPIWLIDLFIPSNIDAMTQEFFQTLASGNDGDGLSILYGNFQKESISDNLWLVTDAEVMSNGTLKFAFNLKRKIVRKEADLLKEIWEFEQQLWKAFYLDFERIKLRNMCP